MVRVFDSCVGRTLNLNTHCRARNLFRRVEDFIFELAREYMIGFLEVCR